MGRLGRLGAISLAVLLAGIFFVLSAFAGVAMRDQAKASEDLKKQVIELQNTQLAAGLPVEEQAALVKGAKIDTTRLNTYTNGPVSFSYPKSLKLKEVGPQQVELASDDKLFGSAYVPKGGILAKVQYDVNLALNTIKDYETPYATKRDVVLKDGKQVLIANNELNGYKWGVMLVARTPQGPYDFITWHPDSPQAEEVAETIRATFKVNK